MPVIIILVVGLFVGAVILVIIGMRNPDGGDADALQQRLEEFTARGEQVNLEDIEMSQPFTQRVIYPLARKLGEIAIKFTPQNAMQGISKKLEMAGSPPGLDPTLFLSMQFIFAAVFGGGLIMFFVFGSLKWGMGVKIIVALLFTIIGFYFPQLWITSKIQNRQKEIRKAMPDALDLLTICVEAGLGFDAAMNKVSEKWDNQLSLALTRVIREIQLGKLRREALRDMAERIGIPEMTSFVAAVIQSEQLGVSMAKVLRIQSEQMRMKRRQHAEEEAHKAPIKMLFPMALLIFPSLMIVLMTPAILRIMNSALMNL